MNIEDWVQERIEYEQFDKVTIGRKSYLVIYEKNEEHLKLRERVLEEDFYEMFRPVFQDIESPSQLTKERLEEASNPAPDSETQLGQADWGYKRIIDYWDEEDII